MSPTFGPSARRAVLAVFATLAAACGGGDGPTAPAASGPGALRLRNDTSTPVWYVYVRSCGATAWGADRLGSDVLMPNGVARMPLPAGCYDVRFESSAQNARSHERRGVAVQAAREADVVLAAW